MKDTVKYGLTILVLIILGVYIYFLVISFSPDSSVFVPR